MLNLADLEKRWFRYKLKSYIPYGTVFVAGSIIVGALLWFLPVKNNAGDKQQQTLQTTQVPLTHTPKKVKTTQHIPIVKQKEKVRQHISNEKTTRLAPSFAFLTHIKSTNDMIVPQKKATVQKHAEKKHTESIKQHKAEQDNQNIITKSTSNHNIIQIKKQETRQDIQEIINRFKNNHNPALSLFVAKKYYELGNYEQSYNYALITNQINNNIEGSWIIFAKSLAKLHKKEMAIRTLQKYIEYSHSSNAQIILNNIQSGKFR